MKIDRFENIISWQKSQEIAFDIYSNFKNVRDFGFRNQICRAAVSISNNIAEGFDRNSDKEFIRFLYISSASCSEVRSMLYLAERLNYLTPDVSRNLRMRSEEISKINKGLIKSLSKINN